MVLGENRKWYAQISSGGAMLDDKELRQILEHLPIALRAAFAYRCVCRVRGLSKPSIAPNESYGGLFGPLMDSLFATAKFATDPTSPQPAPETIDKITAGFVTYVTELTSQIEDPATLEEDRKRKRSALLSSLSGRQAFHLVLNSRENPNATIVNAENAARHAIAAVQVSWDSTIIEDAVRLDLNKLDLLGLNASDLKNHIDPTEKGPLGSLWPVEVPEWANRKTVIEARDIPYATRNLSDVETGPALAALQASATLTATSTFTATGVLGHGESPIQSVPPLEVYLDPGDAPQELITEFFLTLSAYYESLGGSGLQILKDEQRSLVVEEAPL
jgi:hypothetical protein